MKAFEYNGLLQKDKKGARWVSPAFVEVDDKNCVKSLKAKPRSGVKYAKRPTYVIPGIPNAHSHAFQYAMAGRAESLGNKDDDFWTWREQMYELALSMKPEQLLNTATALYRDLKKNGFSSVAEFHYLHHDPKGKAYASPGKMVQALGEAAKKAGVALTLVPVYYRNGDFDEPATKRQRRFVFESLKNFQDYWSKLDTWAKKEGHRLGAGLHSLRAASRDEVKEIFQWAPEDRPFHVHVAEQTKEVELCYARWGKRPVEWLLSEVEMGPHCHLVHATHLTSVERKGIIHSQARVVLCPTTEANLGDGIFPFREFHQEGGNWCVGSDSHVGVNPFEELRWLDYGQRLVHKKRNVVCTKLGQQSGDVLFWGAWKGGQGALGTGAKSALCEGDIFEHHEFKLAEEPKAEDEWKSVLSRVIF